jgi:cell division protein FtsI/penicillin-binding protein 2
MPIYTSAFIGAFPIEKPLYYCFAMIQNQSSAPIFYGHQVAKPVAEIVLNYYLKNNK